MTDAPERIWATEDTAHFGEDRFHSTTPMRGLTEYLRADIAAARDADLRAKIEQLGREVNISRYGQPDFAWSIHKAAMDDLRAEVERCHARLEIDHAFTVGPDDQPVRYEIPMAERASMPDGIECRDATIKLQDEQIARLRGLLDEAREGLKGWLNIAAHCNITDGSCCCGEDMRNHSPAMDCGHVAVDHGGYVTDQQIRATEATLAKIGGQHD